jgi:hypothetical protein
MVWDSAGTQCIPGGQEQGFPDIHSPSLIQRGQNSPPMSFHEKRTGQEALSRSHFSMSFCMYGFMLTSFVKLKLTLSRLYGGKNK